MKRKFLKLSYNELVHQYLQGEHEAINVLVSKVSHMVWKKVLVAVKNKEEAADLCQEVMVHLVDKIRLGAYVEGAFLSWFHILVSNYICSYHRKRKVYFQCEGLENLKEETDHTVCSYEQALQDLEKTLLHLPKMSQVLIRMRYWRKMSYLEIAHHTGINQSTVVKRIRVCCKLLRIKMEQLGYDGADY